MTLAPSAAERPLLARIISWFRRYLIAGFLVMLPLILTVWLLYSLFSAVENVMKALLIRIEGVHYFPGLGVVVTFLLLLGTGIFAKNVIGRRIIRSVEQRVLQLPFVSKVYGTVSQIRDTFIGSESTLFSKLVLVEYPRKGLFSLGFITADVAGEIATRLGNADLCSVFVPTTPNPTSGILIFVPKADVIELDMSLEDGMKLVISGGALVPLPPTQE